MISKSRNAAIAVLVVAALFVIVSGAWIAAGPPARTFTDRAAIEAFLARQGPWAPAILIALQALQVVVAPIPGYVLGIVGGLLFGAWRGTLYTVIGVGIGSGIVMALARWFGRPLAERLVGPRATARIDAWAARPSPLFYFVLFLVPFMPDDVACFAIGLSRLPLLPMLLLVVVARLPGHFLAAWLGATARDLSGTAWAVAGAVGAVLLVLGWWQRDRLPRWDWAVGPTAERTEKSGPREPSDPVD